jgi:hypothetical protein
MCYISYLANIIHLLRWTAGFLSVACSLITKKCHYARKSVTAVYVKLNVSLNAVINNRVFRVNHRLAEMYVELDKIISWSLNVKN